MCILNSTILAVRLIYLYDYPTRQIFDDVLHIKLVKVLGILLHDISSLKLTFLSIDSGRVRKGIHHFNLQYVTANS